MRAVAHDAYGPPERVLGVHVVPRPVAKDDQVLIRVRAAGVDMGVWHYTAGMPLVGRLGFGLRAPRSRVRGMDVAGVVEAVGAKVRHFAPGDAVYGVGQGTFAEYATARADKVAPMPAGLTFEEAAAVPTSATTALRGLRDKARVAPGQRVVVVGAGGGVGSFAVQLAKAYGATVTGVCGPTKVDLVRKLGADDVVDYTREDFTASGRRWDAIIDIAGNRPLARLRRVLTPRGTLVLLGGEGGGRWLGGLERNLGLQVLAPFVRHRMSAPIAITGPDDLRALSELIDAGRIRPAVDRTYPLDEAPDAVAYLRAGRACGKVVVTV